MFYIFHLWKAFREYHFVLRGPIQNEQKLCFVQAKRLFCYHAREKMEMPVDPRNPMPKRLRKIFSQLCHKHVGSSSKMELVMEASCLHWKFRAHFQRFSLVPPWHLSFWAKTIGFHLFEIFFCMCKRNYIFYQRNINVTTSHPTPRISNVASCRCASAKERY